MDTGSKIQGVYAILDTAVSAGEDLAALARDYLEGGIRILQVRDKEGSRRREILGRILDLKKAFDFTLMVNDDLTLTRELGADGVHVGKDDAPIEECRKILGPSKLVGYSSHALEEAVEAEQRGADYVAFGAVFPTPTKGPGHPVQGLARLKEVVCALKIPVVAIGGINRSNIEGVLRTGVASVAMISALARAKDRVEEARFFSRLFS